MSKSTVCIVCGCGGSDGIDHLLSVREHPELEWDVANLAPIHHLPCPYCSERAGKPIRCNYIKGYGSLEVARRIWAERVGQVSPETPEQDSGEWW